MARPPANTGTGSPPPGLEPADTGPATAAQARDTARAFLAALVPRPSNESIENAVLIVSELVTNALRHAGRATSLDLAADPSTLRVSVRDPSPVPPRERTPDLRGYEGGFGWLLVRYLAKSVAVTPAADGGKNVCVALPR
ncbi:ATP-binding protein [Streptomyces sp. NBC_00083]|uniref:ATP-binding protein n=1 Tax=Streptomyces sp. NBC_00083 TaxID=2975647 RepID=UPI002252336D|nr:ATP-binding protein [Streptomyces sp. NBC_00083]MCX5387193.1 ATP-binding protein [Streptomyces sp. NBC_00083]